MDLTLEFGNLARLSVANIHQICFFMHNGSMVCKNFIGCLLVVMVCGLMNLVAPTVSYYSWLMKLTDVFPGLRKKAAAFFIVWSKGAL